MRIKQHERYNNIKQHERYNNIYAKVEGAHSFGIILNVPTKVSLTKLCTGKSVLFELLGL